MILNSFYFGNYRETYVIRITSKVGMIYDIKYVLSVDINV